MEPERQFEIQLGHMCNNRCVFCVSGQRTAMREAFPLEAAPIIERLREGREQGMRKVTLLGGEPTIQPGFIEVVRAAAEMGFVEVVVFTNGVKTSRGSFVDEALATGANLTWRLSFQGATLMAHERTTKKLGSFSRLRETLANLRDRGQRITVNMCVVTSNYASVASFPSLILPYGARQLHLDMVRPLDAGVRTEDEMRGMIPRYPELAAPLRAMIEEFERASPGFDVNIGNLPYCIAPDLAPWIHHDGERTLTVAVDARDTLSEPWDKYLVKARDKVKTERCVECVFHDQCSGVYETYGRFYGYDDFQPVTPARLLALDPQQRLFTLHLKAFVDGLAAWSPPAPFARVTAFTDSRDGEVRLRFEGDSDALATASLRRGGSGAGGVAATERASLHLLDTNRPTATTALLRAVFARLQEHDGSRVLHAVGDDAVASNVDRRIGQCLARLRSKAPFGELTWRDATVSAGGREATVSLGTRDGNTVTVALTLKGSSVSGGYRLAAPEASPTPSLVSSVRAVMEALRPPAPPVPSPPVPSPLAP